MNENHVVSRALYEAILMVLDDTQRVLRTALQEKDALRDMLDDSRSEMEMLRVVLGVPYEPHQNLYERMLDAARTRTDENMCQSCVNDKCVTGPECVTLGRDSTNVLKGD